MFFFNWCGFSFVSCRKIFFFESVWTFSKTNEIGSTVINGPLWDILNIWSPWYALSSVICLQTLPTYITSTVLMIMLPSWEMEHLQANNHAQWEPKTPLFYCTSYSFLLEYFKRHINGEAVQVSRRLTEFTPRYNI